MCTTIYFYLLKFLQFRLLEDFFIKNNKAGCIYKFKKILNAADKHLFYSFRIFFYSLDDLTVWIAHLSSVFLFVIWFSSILFYLLTLI